MTDSSELVSEQNIKLSTKIHVYNSSQVLLIVFSTNLVFTVICSLLFYNKLAYN